MQRITSTEPLRVPTNLIPVSNPLPSSNLASIRLETGSLSCPLPLLSLSLLLFPSCSFSAFFSRPLAISARFPSPHFLLVLSPYISPYIIFSQLFSLFSSPTPSILASSHSRYPIPSPSSIAVGATLLPDRKKPAPSHPRFSTQTPSPVPLSLQLHPDSAPSDTTSVNWFTIGPVINGLLVTRLSVPGGRCRRGLGRSFRQSKIGRKTNRFAANDSPRMYVHR